MFVGGAVADGRGARHRRGPQPAPAAIGVGGLFFLGGPRPKDGAAAAARQPRRAGGDRLRDRGGAARTRRPRWACSRRSPASDCAVCGAPATARSTATRLRLIRELGAARSPGCCFPASSRWPTAISARRTISPAAQRDRVGVAEMAGRGPVHCADRRRLRHSSRLSLERGEAAQQHGAVGTLRRRLTSTSRGSEATK